MESKIVRSLGDAEKALQGLALKAEEIWTVGSKLIRSSIDEITHHIENPGGLALIGSEFMISDKTTKTIYKFDPEKKVQQLYVDLMNVKSNSVPSLLDMVKPILNAEGTIISAMAFNQGKLWITVQAGYSSSVIVIDDQTKELTNCFYTRGPEPLGIAFESGKEAACWVLDGSNKELSQFDITGNWTQVALNVPLEKPSGLAMDNEGNFFIADLATNKIYKLVKGGSEWVNMLS